LGGVTIGILVGIGVGILVCVGAFNSFVDGLGKMFGGK
jgi:hypothetical protein